MTEHDEQKAVITWARMQYKDLLIFAIPNGGQRHPAIARKLKAEGVLAGIPDLCLISQDQICFIEMKTPTGKLSNTQKAMKRKIEDYGIRVEVCYGFENAKEFIERWI